MYPRLIHSSLWFDFFSPSIVDQLVKGSGTVILIWPSLKSFKREEQSSQFTLQWFTHVTTMFCCSSISFCWPYLGIYKQYQVSHRVQIILFPLLHISVLFAIQFRNNTKNPLSLLHFFSNGSFLKVLYYTLVIETPKCFQSIRESFQGCVILFKKYI